MFLASGLEKGAGFFLKTDEESEN